MSSQVNSSPSIEDFKNMPRSKALNGKQVMWLEWLDTVMMIWKFFIIYQWTMNTHNVWSMLFPSTVNRDTHVLLGLQLHTRLKMAMSKSVQSIFSQMTQGMLMMFKCCNHVQHRWTMARSHFRHQGGNGEWCSDFCTLESCCMLICVVP